jgi:tRNA-Thr(GGU) m(6)t(6)A37 methyltransferase TsaA
VIGAVAEETTSGGGSPAGGYEVRPVGRVESTIADRAQAPLQGTEGAPEAWLVFDDAVSACITDLHPGAEILVLTWLHRARRDILRVFPRGNTDNAEEGVFSTRSPDRPNPIGLHRVTIVDVHERRIRVSDLEAIDGTPIIDVKPVLGPRER